MTDLKSIDGATTHSSESEELGAELANLNLGGGAPKSPEEVLARCNALLAELKIFSDYLESQKYNGDYRQRPEYKHFRGDIEGEVKAMEKLIQSAKASSTATEGAGNEDLGESEEAREIRGRTEQLVSASNLTYWEALWDAAKQTKQIVVLRRHGSPIDIIFQNGTLWTKVSTVTEKRLLMEMAKQGWDWAGLSDSEDEDDDETYGSGPDKLEDVDISIVKMAVTLRDMAKEKRVRYQRPKIHFILTRIKRGNKDIDMVLDHILATGATLTTTEDLHPAPPIESVLQDLGIDEFRHFTPTLNVDCTLLLAIVSDISHGQVNEEPWFNRNVRAQITLEEKEQLMCQTLWPAMDGKRLVCTSLAAKRMREIVEMIGTGTEKARMRVMMGDNQARRSHEELLQDFGALSLHAVPRDWQLPIEIMDEDALERGKAREQHRKVMSSLVDVNRSVFMYGWLSGCTTITSNRVAVKALERGVEEHRVSEEDRGPEVWICPVARSLVAKEKNRGN